MILKASEQQRNNPLSEETVQSEEKVFMTFHSEGVSIQDAQET